VANPDGTLSGSQQEAEAVCTAFYPDAVYLGQSDRIPVSGIGTPDEVLRFLPGSTPGSTPDWGPGAVRPAVLHLGCHARAGSSPDESQLLLADREALPVRRILAQARDRDRDAPGGLVVLAACTSDLTLADYDEALTLTSAFLAAGVAAAVGARWSVDDQFTALLMFMFHRHLVHHPDDGPAGALRAAQLWMLDPDRELPAELPDEFTRSAGRTATPFDWAAFTCHGQ
jgi:CHAT domain-containing protein